MRDTLENLYFGVITPNERQTRPNSSLQKAMEQSEECEEKLTKTQKKIWMYMKFHPDVISYRAIARGVGVTRHTVAKWYVMMGWMLGRTPT